MDFNLTDEQELIVASYRDYMESENWETYFHECDEKHVYPLRWVAGLCELGFDQIMLPVISEPRAEVSQYAPKMITMHIDPERIREVIGKGGSVIQKIVADTGAKVDIDDDGTIHIASANAAACDAAKKCIDDIVFVPEVGKLYYGKVVRILPIGAFVELAPGKDGMIHISKLENRRVEKVEDVLNIGDMTWVKVTEIDDRGRVNLSRKEALKERGEA